MARSLYAGFFQLPFLPEAALSANGYRSLKQALVRSGRSGTFSEDDLRHYEETWSRSGALTAMINWYRALPLAPTREVLRTRLSMPVRVLWGVDDPFLEKGLAEDSLALCDNGTALWVEKAGHFVQHEEPDLINRALVDFLKA
jgi:pimeloyl-ACP methyl ester carboxylesterase